MKKTNPSIYPLIELPNGRYALVLEQETPEFERSDDRPVPATDQAPEEDS